jgi:hypothetical protein
MTQQRNEHLPTKHETDLSELEQIPTVIAVPDEAKVEGGYRVGVQDGDIAHLKLAKNGRVRLGFFSRPVPRC